MIISLKFNLAQVVKEETSLATSLDQHQPLIIICLEENEKHQR
jgi:hypothetical protein